MDDLSAIFAAVEARGTIERHERDMLMSSHTDAWVICADVIGEPFRSPGVVPVTPAQLAEIRARIAKQYKLELANHGFQGAVVKQFKAFRAWFRFLTA